MAKANTRPGVEGEEDERVRDDILLHAFVDEPLGVERKRYVVKLDTIL